jgi:hypothetical protein
VPGFPPSQDMSHDIDIVDRGGSRGPKGRRVDRHSTQHFIRGIKDTIRWTKGGGGFLK